MATRTTTVAPSRPFDAVYDPTHTLSDARDFARSNARAQALGSRVVPVPDSQNMFSALVHVPRGTVAMKATTSIPAELKSDFKSVQAQQQSVLRQQKAESQPTGRDYIAKYFYRPRVPYAPGSETLTLVRTARPKLADTSRSEAVVPATRTVHVQTDYRENDTQTDPWTPEYIVRPGSAPEVLTLATLTYGHGLPAGLAEVEMIERARAKRAWEETLPPMNDPSGLAERQRMMEQREMEEWKLREEEIARLQEQRLAILQAQLRLRTEQHSQDTNERLENLWQTRQKAHSALQQRAHKDTLVQLRRIARERANVEPSVARRDIVQDYANPASAVFAPKDREGGFTIDNVPTDNVVNSKYLTTYRGLLELEASLPQSLTQPRIVVPQRPSSSARPKLVGMAARNTAKLGETVRTVHLSLTTKPQTPLPEPPLRFCEEIVPPPVRPPTPTVDVPSQEAEEADLAVTLLQQLIRGRAAQNAMYIGREQRRELIAELRSTHALQEAEVARKAAMQASVEGARAEAVASEQARKLKHSTIMDVQAEHVGDTLDFLSKELVRLQEQRRIHAFVMLAERTRRLREAEESGKRQIEEERRHQHDEVFRQMAGVHMESVESYLEEVVLSARQAVADQQARGEVRRQAVVIAELSDAAHASGLDATPEGAEAIVADLVSSFLLPEVQRQSARDAVQRHQRRLIHAAHKEIFSEAQSLEENAPSRTAPRTSRASSAASRPASSTARVRSAAAGRAQSAAADGRLSAVGEVAPE